MPARRGGTRPRPARQRHRVSGELLLSLAEHLTERDHRILAYLGEHELLTTPQIRDLAFGSTRQAQRRLAELAGLGLLSRLRPRVSRGSAPIHWILGPAGVVVLAADLRADVRTIGALRRRALTLAVGQHRRHRVGVNGFFTRLVADDSGQLELWWSERHCARRWGHVIVPDGYGHWRQGGQAIGFWLEYDRGTESLADLVDKVDAYADLAHVRGPTGQNRPPWLLIRLGSERRERDLRRLLPIRTIVPVATAGEPETPSPATAIWSPVDRAERMPLIGLLEADRHPAADTGTPP